MAVCLTLIVVAGCKNNGNRNSSTDSMELSDTVFSDDKIVTDTVPKDTVDIETYLSKMEPMLDELKQIHINKPEDTLKYKLLEEKWDRIGNFEIRDTDRNGLKHSVKVRFLEYVVGLDSEHKRLANEAKAAGVAEFEDFDKEDSEWNEGVQEFRRQLWLETH